MTCVPAFAPATSDGSMSDGIVASRTGCSGSRPYFDASNARSTSSIDVVPTWIRPRRSRASSPAAGNAGSPSSTRLTLASVPGVRMLPARQRSDGPSVTGSTRPVSSCLGSMPETIAGAAISSPDARATPVARPSFEVIATTRAPVRISAPAALAADGEGIGERRRPTLREDRLAGGTAVVARGVGQEHGGRARRPRAHRRVADATPGERRAQRLGREQFGHEVRGRHREHAQDRPAIDLAQAPERRARAAARGARRRRRAAWISGGASSPRSAMKLGERADAPVEVHERGRVVRGPAADRVHGCREVAPQRDRPAVGLRREHAHLGRDQRQAVTGERELAGHGWSQPADRVGERGDAHAGRELLRDGRATDALASLEHEDAEAARREVGGGGQAVVAGADDDRVVGGRAGGRRCRHLRPPSGRGPSGARARPAARWRPSGRRRDAWTSPTATGRGSASGSGRTRAPAG